jgi:phospholipase D1/2
MSLLKSVQITPFVVSYSHIYQLTVFDVFLVDSDFKISRPTRYYRQGLHLLHADGEKDESHKGKGKERLEVPHKPETDRLSTFGSIKSRVSNVFRRSKDSHRDGETQEAEDDSSSASSSSSRAPTPLLDPSTNTNPLLDGDERGDRGGEKKKSNDEVSKHTFYIENAQMRLKLYARNEVWFSVLIYSKR